MSAIYWLTNWNASIFKNKESIFNVNFDTQLSYKVQKFIRLVSEKTSNDFRQDKRLYKGLISHIRAALKRIENDPITSFKDTSLAPVEYQLISPVLADKDIDLLKDFIETYKLGHKNPLTNHFGDDNYKLTFEEMRDSILIADDLLKQFEVKDIDSKEHVEATVEAVMQSVKPLAVSDDALVSQAIIKRYKTTPIGIPKTNMSLFHSAIS